MTQSPFIYLVRMGLDMDSLREFSPLDEKEWDRIFKLAKKQSVIGVVFRGAMKLPTELQPPRKVKIRFAMTSEKIGEQNRHLDECCRSLCRELETLGLSSCILKGQGLSRLYPETGSRQCGDIDLWVPGDRKYILRQLRSRWKTGSVFYHHVDLDVYSGKPEVEVHFTPSWMNNPFINMRLQEYFRSVAELQTSNRLEEFGCSVPQSDFNLVFNMIHIYRHLLFEGVGLRQVIDYCLLLEHSSGDERNAAYEILSSFGMKRICGAVMYAMQEFFALDEGYLLCPPDRHYGEKFIFEVMRGGNFGRYDRRNAGIAKAGAFKRFYKRMIRLSDFLLTYPSEVLWAPYFKIRQRIWRFFVEK